MEYLTSLNNNRIKNIAKLIKSSRFRRERGAFVAEGLRLVSEIPESRIRELYIEESFYEKLEAENGFDERLMNLMEAAEEQRECFLVSEAVMKKLSDTDTPQGILAVVDMMGEASDNCTADDVTNESANEQLTDNAKKNAPESVDGWKY
jgi:rRNA methylases